MTRDVTCPECGSRNVRILWRAKDEDDLDSMACGDCDHRWAE